jgi:hypothetical protein
MSVIHGMPPAPAEITASSLTTEFTLKLTPALRMETTLDAGCGVRFFSQTLEKCGLSVCGFKGRKENNFEARRRFPQVPFETADLEDRSILELGRFDFVLCCGLLYHLENPLLAMRNLRALTEKCLLVESMSIPGEKASMLLREEPRAEDQSLTDVACYPSEGTLVKMLYRAGFAVVYRVTPVSELVTVTTMGLVVAGKLTGLGAMVTAGVSGGGV